MNKNTSKECNKCNTVGGIWVNYCTARGGVTCDGESIRVVLQKYKIKK